MGASSSKHNELGPALPASGEVQCLGLVTKVCALLDGAAAKKGPALQQAVGARTETARALATLDPASQHELLSLKGLQVLQVASELHKLEGSLKQCHSKALKLSKQPSVLAGRRQVARQADKILIELAHAHLRFRMAVKTVALGNAASATARVAADGSADMKNARQCIPSGRQDEAVQVAPLPHSRLQPLGSPRNDPLGTLKAAAEGGDAAAALELGDMYRAGQAAVAQDPAEALHYYLTAAAVGSADACFALGQMAELGEGSVDARPLEALRWYEKAAKAGHLEGMVEYAYLLEHGEHLPKDEEAAVQLYRTAAMKGSSRAQNNLAKMLFDGRGVDRDLVLAVDWFRQAADNGSVAALANLGICYEDGLGIDGDLDMAEAYYTHAAAAGHEVARTNLAILAMRKHANGCGPASSKASQQLPSTASHSITSGQADAPVHFEQMTVIPSPPSGAQQLPSGGGADAGDSVDSRMEAAQAGDAQAQHWVASLYWDEGEVASALYFYQAAAAQKHAGALIALAIIAEEGQGGVQPDAALALHYYQLASLQGSQEAAARLRTLQPQVQLGGA